MSAVSNHPVVTTRIPECGPKEYFDARAMTSKLIERCPDMANTQTVPHPPVTTESVLKPTVNLFRKQVLWKYPFLVNKDSLYDKKDKIYRDPEEMMSTYKRDYGCELGDIELVRSTGQPPLPETSLQRPPADLPKNRLKISAEMSVFYALPGGRWLLNARDKPRTPVGLNPVHKFRPPKWESEYRANINGIAKLMREKKVLTRRVVRVHRVPTLPED